MGGIDITNLLQLFYRIFLIPEKSELQIFKDLFKNDIVDIDD